MLHIIKQLQVAALSQVNRSSYQTRMLFPQVNLISQLLGVSFPSEICTCWRQIFQRTPADYYSSDRNPELHLCLTNVVLECILTHRCTCICLSTRLLIPCKDHPSNTSGLLLDHNIDLRCWSSKLGESPSCLNHSALPFGFRFGWLIIYYTLFQGHLHFQEFTWNQIAVAKSENQEYATTHVGTSSIIFVSLQLSWLMIYFILSRHFLHRQYLI